MDILQAKQTVIKAGKMLVEYGLIVRTWGNISCRISDTQFVITPSGKPYENLTPDDIVLVNTNDLSYEGDIKPSSEKGIHAQCYLKKPDVNFVIHTHQMNASIVSVLGEDIKGITGRSAEIVGEEILMGGYGLPGTGKLREGVVSALRFTNSKAVIMAHHGALCMGKDFEEAFNVANEVEIICAKFVLKKYKAVTGKATDAIDSVAEYIGEKFKKGETCEILEKSDSKKDGSIVTVMNKQGEELFTIDLNGDNTNISREGAIHKAVYDGRKDVNYVIHSDLPDVHAYSRLGKKMKPLLDDFAQIAGTTVKCVKYKNTPCTLKKIAKATKGGRSAVLLKDNGALCFGSDEYNAEASEIVVEKNSKAYMGALLFDKVSPISPLESKLMNVVYRFKYSKQAK